MTIKNPDESYESIEEKIDRLERQIDDLRSELDRHEELIEEIVIDLQTYIGSN